MKIFSFVVNTLFLLVVIQLIIFAIRVTFILSWYTTIDQNLMFNKMFKVDWATTGVTFYANFWNTYAGYMYAAVLFFIILLGWGIFNLIFEKRLKRMVKINIKHNKYLTQYCPFLSWTAIFLGSCGLFLTLAYIFTYVGSSITITADRNYTITGAIKAAITVKVNGAKDTYYFDVGWEYALYPKYIVNLTYLVIAVFGLNYLLAIFYHYKLEFDPKISSDPKLLGWKMPANIPVEPIKKQIQDIKSIKHFVYNSTLWISADLPKDSSEELLKETYLNLTSTRKQEYAMLREYAKDHYYEITIKDRSLKVAVFPFVMEPTQVFEWVKTKLFLKKHKKWLQFVILILQFNCQFL
ncbi:hypothetical protein SCLARK_001165 [Spiroplasma clarkii]|uniref:hypothetical protein n=1 Tax=Spiroplasma clarkii TaxID=2139 RepID=UPI000B54F32C|nr:hypothetical protein [Spiroplasma clarkii]ARU91723.1 hypothetical protein SCLARK_001165 [Spiroplasma clarkii]